MVPGDAAVPPGDGPRGAGGRRCTPGGWAAAVGGWARSREDGPGRPPSRYDEGVAASSADWEVLDAVAGSARLEGIEVPERHTASAAAYLAGEVDAATYEAWVRSLIVTELGLDA